MLRKFALLEHINLQLARVQLKSAYFAPKENIPPDPGRLQRENVFFVVEGNTNQTWGLPSANRVLLESSRVVWACGDATTASRENTTRSLAKQFVPLVILESTRQGSGQHTATRVLLERTSLDPDQNTNAIYALEELISPKSNPRPVLHVKRESIPQDWLLLRATRSRKWIALASRMAQQ